VKREACARARAEAAKRAGHHVLRADVDGDGVSDRVLFFRLRRGNARCGAVLVVRIRSGTLARAFSTILDAPFPSLNGLAAITAGPGLQVVVTAWEGASTAFAARSQPDRNQPLPGPSAPPPARVQGAAALPELHACARRRGVERR
jgi:hypothetical protein